ncbi:hypothetical protein LCGC14_0342850 [marine sediment metagenome]|uniref:Uncharacterized protein n=1 Tax=marine sediment metagenome TaxID=412755 RepID=A0A0F9TVW2_9ZZZZ
MNMEKLTVKVISGKSDRRMIVTHWRDKSGVKRSETLHQRHNNESHKWYSKHGGGMD